MIPDPQDDSPVEPDDRFPSGPWTGFFLMPRSSKRHGMELVLTFRNGAMHGIGRDWVGEFLIRGRYQVEDGKCWWTKSYIGKHDVAYQGYNEGKGIWGTWEISAALRGGFHIWPVGMADPTQQTLAEELDAPPAEAVVEPQEALAESVS